MNTNTDIQVDDWSNAIYPNAIIVDIKEAVKEFHEQVSGMCEYEDCLDGIIDEVLTHIAVENYAECGIDSMVQDYRVCFTHQDDGTLIGNAVKAIGNALKIEMSANGMYNQDGFLPPYRLASWVREDQSILLKKDIRKIVEEESMYDDALFEIDEFTEALL
jgi:hypothetical protein